MLTVCTWVWGTKYGPEYMARLSRGIAANLKQEHRFCVFEPRPEDQYLTKVRGCFARLRAFDPEWQESKGIKPGERIACVDLDNVITGPLDVILDIDEPFAILQGANAANPCPYNGSVWMLRAGYRPDVWSDFSLEAASKIPQFEFPDDQGWLAHKLPGAKSWKVAASGIYGFEKPGWPKGSTELPANASIVAFFGKRDPVKFRHLDWVKEHWR